MARPAINPHLALIVAISNPASRSGDLRQVERVWNPGRRQFPRGPKSWKTMAYGSHLPATLVWSQRNTTRAS